MSNFLTEAVIRLQVALTAARERQEGQTLVEYSLILAMVSIGSIAALLVLSGKINAVFTTISNTL
jgi:Flp pilus assembly pilin Flp